MANSNVSDLLEKSLASDVIPAGDLSRPKRVSDNRSWGLYLHIPFCPYICHYCDFVKSAYFEKAFQEKYLVWLEAQLDYWLLYYQKEGPNKALASVNFGGGTPSIYSSELLPLFKKLAPYIDKDTEISLEANPEHLTLANFEAWQKLGINRLSVGVQSFQSEGLAFLKRRHETSQTQAALKLARSYFDNLNLDLIYSWPRQTLKSWQADLEIAIALGVNHLSLYNLTYENSTPIGKAALRGKIKITADNRQAAFYEHARTILNKAGFLHEEVSNWAKPGYSCRHNWLYWTDHYYIGIGSGAHGYLPDPENPCGLRYSYPSAIQKIDALTLAPALAPKEQDFLIHDPRRPSDWLLEVLLAGLRTEKGIDLARLKEMGFAFQGDSEIRGYRKDGIIQIEGDRLKLTPKEWFRENFWILKLERYFSWSPLR